MMGVDCRVRMTTLLWGSQSKIHSTQHCVPYSRIHLSNVKGLKCQSEAQQDNGEGPKNLYLWTLKFEFHVMTYYSFLYFINN